MFKRKRINNEDGLILFTVIVIAIIASVLVMGLLSLSVSQATRSEQSVQSVQAQMLARGMLFRYHQLQTQGCPNPPCTTSGDCSTCSFPPVDIGGTTYSFAVARATNNIGPGGTSTNQISIQVNY